MPTWKKHMADLKKSFPNLFEGATKQLESYVGTRPTKDGEEFDSSIQKMEELFHS